MVNRFWDPSNRYVEGFLKEFDHWIAEVSYRQHTLGSFILFCKRPLEKFSDLTPEELVDLTQSMKAVEQALKSSPEFQPDRFNYWQMGNKLHHLHFHGIPRYSSSRIFQEKVWVDSTYGKPPIWSAEEAETPIIHAIRSNLHSYL